MANSKKTKIYQKEKNESLRSEELEELAKGIKKGKVAILPTETVYGMIASAFDEKAIREVFRVKERPIAKALIVLISEVEMLEGMIAPPNEIEKKLMDTFWPGPLTIIFQMNKECPLSPIINQNLETIAIRLTSGTIIKELIAYSKIPLVAPSANITGKESGTKIKEIKNVFLDKVDFLVDVGDILENTPSTMVKVENNKIRILRSGKIKKEELEKIAPVVE